MSNGLELILTKGCTIARQNNGNGLFFFPSYCFFLRAFTRLDGTEQTQADWKEQVALPSWPLPPRNVGFSLTLAFVRLLWRGNEYHHHQFQWLPLSPVCVRRDLGSSWFLLLDICPFLLRFFSFFPLVPQKLSAVSQQAMSFAALAPECR